jgi:hypothetical protein
MLGPMRDTTDTRDGARCGLLWLLALLALALWATACGPPSQPANDQTTVTVSPPTGSAPGPAPTAPPPPSK